MVTTSCPPAAPAAPSAASSLLGRPRGALVLQAMRGDHPGELFRRYDAKITVGADVGCTIRVDSSSADLVHCSIFRGEARTIVRCWSNNTRWNGLVFQEAELQAGDRLQVADWDFEVVDLAERDADEIVCRGAKPSAPIELEDLFRKIGRTDLLETAVPGPPSVPSAVDSVPGASHSVQSTQYSEPKSEPALAPSHDANDETALADYVAELLQRLSGGRNAAPSVEPIAPEDTVAEEEPTAADVEPNKKITAVASSPSPPRAAPVAVGKPNCLGPVAASPRPEPHRAEPRGQSIRPGELHAMRELANATARTAILRFETNQSAKDLLNKAVIAIMGMVCAILMAYWTIVHGQLSMLVGALSGMAVATVWGVQMMQQARKLKTVQSQTDLSPTATSRS